MAPRDQSPRASDHRRPYSDRRDHNPRDTRDTRPRRDRSTSRERTSYAPRGGRGGAHRGADRETHNHNSHRDNRQARSRSPVRSSHNTTRQRSPPRAPRGAPNPRDRKPNVKAEEAVAPAVDPNEDEETAMKRLMGFNGFRSTKNTKVPGNDKLYGVRKDKKTEYRQYMNRVGGFNRPLSPTRM